MTNFICLGGHANPLQSGLLPAQFDFLILSLSAGKNVITKWLSTNSFNAIIFGTSVDSEPLENVSTRVYSFTYTCDVAEIAREDAFAGKRFSRKKSLKSIGRTWSTTFPGLSMISWMVTSAKGSANKAQSAEFSTTYLKLFEHRQHDAAKVLHILFLIPDWLVQRCWEDAMFVLLRRELFGD